MSVYIYTYKIEVYIQNGAMMLAVWERIRVSYGLKTLVYIWTP